jgi:hypothetical protein
MVTFKLFLTPLHGDQVAVDSLSELDRVVADGFVRATLRLNLSSLPPLGKLNVAAVLYKSRHLLSSGMLVVGPDTSPVNAAGALNPIFSGGRFSGPALDRFVETTVKTFGFAYEAAKQELVLQFGDNPHVVQAVTRRLLNLAAFCTNYTKRFNTSKKFRWETFDSITRLKSLPTVTTTAEDREET